MKALVAILIASVTMLSPAVKAAEPSLVPDLVIINASIHTMDQARPTVGAMAFFGNSIAAVGSTPEIRLLAGASTRVIDAAQQLILPVFTDNHVSWLIC